jgi:hypothetical protein
VQERRTGADSLATEPPNATERIIQLLESVNPTAVNNDDGKPGEFLAELCREAASRLRKQSELINTCGCTGTCMSRGCNCERRG